MTHEDKDAEIARLKGELAEAVRLLSEAPSNWNGTHRTGCGALTRRGGAGVCNCGRDAWEQAILAFLQKHTPPLNFDKRSNVDPDTLTIKNVIQEISRPAVVSAAGESPSHSGGGGYVGKALSGDWPTKDDALALYADESNWLGYYPPDLKPRPKVWVWQGPVLPPWEAAQNVTGKSALREVPATDHARWLRLLDRALCGCFSLDCRVHGAYDCNDHKWVEAHRQKQEKPEWRPLHMDEGDDYVNEPRTGPASDGPPGQEQKHEKGSALALKNYQKSGASEPLSRTISLAFTASTMERRLCMATEQSDDRCEQIARDLLQTWKNGHLLSESDFQREGRLLRVIKSALQSAKQQGREEAMESWRNQVKAKWGHKTPGKCECAYCRRDFEVVADHAGQLEMECEWLKRQQQPKSEPSQECREIAKDLIEPYVLPYYGPEEFKLEDRVAAALQAKQDELNALREEVMGVIEPFAECADRANALWHPVGSSCDWRFEVDVLRAALALRDKLKASQPTSPQPQTPHQ